ncbi:BTB/POZ and MATH domain-containing protein 2-like [Oryza glaberrima]|nr:BTB/POZ and MATH domain-containing protein 2-like [Oryza glaberrima]
MANDTNNTSSSVIATETTSASHVIKIDGYTVTKDLMENGEFVSSIPFSVGDFLWNVRYYPNGNCSKNADYLSFSVFLESHWAEDVKAKFSFKLLDTNDKPVRSRNFISNTHNFSRRGSNWGYSRFIKKRDLEQSEHLIDDSFTIRCDLTVMKGFSSKGSHCKPSVEVPAGRLDLHLGNLLSNKKMNGKDVTIYVGKERFRAHKCILAARSSVFRALFFGAMIAETPRTIEIEDMEAGVFRLLLHFMYNDSLPETWSQDVMMAQHLLVAADWYNVGRLKLICEEKLAKHIDCNMVVTTLALAEQHSCQGLKEACLEFLASPTNLERMMRTDGYKHLKISCPIVLNELIARLLPPNMKAARQIAMDLR